MGNHYDEIIKLCILGKKENWPNLYLKISTLIKESTGKDYSPEYIRGVSRRYRRKNNLDENFNLINEENIDFYYTDTSKSETSILKEHGFDPNRFSVVNVRQSRWNDMGGNERVSSRITVKPNDQFVYSEEFVKRLFDNIKIDSTNTTNNYKPLQFDNDGSILVIPIADFHYMRYSSSNVVNKDYDREIARNRYYKIISDILERVKNKKIKKIFLVVGNDMLNVDTITGTTTKGTPQENIGDIESAIIEITNILVNTIEKLKKISKVDVVYIPSNHDYLTFFGIANALRIRYENDDNVTVDCSPKERKYKFESSCLLGFAHNIKTENVNNILIEEASEYLSESKTRIYFLAHLHHEFAHDISGTDVRRLPTISSPSRWEYKNGYSSIERCQTFLIDPNYGITDIIYSYID